MRGRLRAGDDEGFDLVLQAAGGFLAQGQVRGGVDGVADCRVGIKRHEGIVGGGRGRRRGEGGDFLGEAFAGLRKLMVEEFGGFFYVGRGKGQGCRISHTSCNSTTPFIAGTSATIIHGGTHGSTHCTPGTSFM